MQNYQEKPIPLVFRRDDLKYYVNPEAIHFLRSIEGKLAIISVAGIYRTGKSFLLNTMLLNSKNGFAVGPTTNPKTKGIWIWGKPLIMKNQNDQIINVLIMDSEGLGSTDEDINHDLRLFSITLLLSSAFMYNTLGAIDQNAIDSLGLVLRLCQHLKNAKFNDFPDFYWILRDFSLALVDKDNNTLSPKMYLQSCLSSQPGDSQIRNQIRSTIKQAFQNRNLFTFIRPLLDESSLQNLDKKPLEELRPEFVEQVLGFRKNIFNNLRIKSIKGREVSGSMLSQLLSIYVEAINEDKVPVIESGWEQLCLKELHEVLDQIEKAVEDKVRQLKGNMPRCKKQLIQQQKKIMEEFQQIFRKRLSNNHRAQEYFGSIKQIVSREMKGIETVMKTKNSQEAQNFVKKEFESIEKRIKDSEFKSMGQLVKQFEIFYEYFRKKCPYKDELNTGMEVLFKKFSDSSLIMYKNLQKRKNNEVENLRQDLEKANSEFNAKEEKYKQDKGTAQNMVAILQSKVEDLTKQNERLISVQEELDTKIEELEAISNKSAEQQLQTQNLSLRKQILELQDNQNQLTCQHNQQISQLRQQLLLKDNQILNLQSYKAELSMKLEQTLSQQQSSNKQYFQESQQLKIELDEVTKEKQATQLNLKQKVGELESQMRVLQAALQAKCSQIAQITESQTIESSIRLEKAINQKENELTQKQQQVITLSLELQTLRQNTSKQIEELQLSLEKKEAHFKSKRLEIQQEMALVEQKLRFVEGECNQKSNKNKILMKENENYTMLFEEKDQRIEQLMQEIEELKNYDEAESSQIQKKITEMATDLENRGQQIVGLEQQIERLETDMVRKDEEIKLMTQESAIITQKLEEQNNGLAENLQQLKQNAELMAIEHEKHIEQLKNENQRYLTEQKRASQLSLVQLKNFYEMEKERLEKKLLEQRRKYEFNEANNTMEIQTKYKKIQRIHIEEISSLKQTNEELLEKSQKMEAQYQAKMINLGEQVQNQRKAYQMKFESIKRKYEEVSQQFLQTQKQYEEERVAYIKKIEGINFDLSRKQKQIMQLNAKKENLEAVVAKRDGQLENMRKTMHTEIENSLKKVSEVQSKCQKISEEYMHFKIESEKQNALCKQKNQFLNARINELNKQKQSGSMKNLEKLQKNKMIELKQQIQRLKSQNTSLESKLENLRKNQKESSASYKRQISQLEKENSYMCQKLEISDSKIKELEIKSSEKYQALLKQLEEMRIKHQKDRSRLQNQNSTYKEKSNELEQKNNDIAWELQKQLALVTERIKFVEYQRDENKKELEETEKRLQAALAQLKKNSDKSMIEESGVRRQSMDKRYTNQLELVKMSSKVRQEELQEINKRLKEENKSLKQKNIDLHEKASKLEKALQSDRNNTQEIDRLKREKDQLILAHRAQISKENQECKRKIIEFEKKNRELERKNSEFIFILQKEKTKGNMERQALEEKIKQLDDRLAWQMRKHQQTLKQKNQSNKTKQFSMTSSDVLGWR